MKKKLALAFVVLFSALTCLQTAANAEDEWFTKYDRGNSGHWTYSQFKKAHSEWYKHHRKETRLSEKELRAKFDALDADHHGWVTRDQARTFHEW
jgi:Ca2+-binding EF-hand superfamily protein